MYTAWPCFQILVRCMLLHQAAGLLTRCLSIAPCMSGQRQTPGQYGDRCRTMVEIAQHTAQHAHISICSLIILHVCCTKNDIA